MARCHQDATRLASDSGDTFEPRRRPTLVKLCPVIPDRMHLSATWQRMEVEEGRALASEHNISMLVDMWRQTPRLETMVDIYRAEPIEDGKAIPEDVLDPLVAEIVNHINGGGVACIACLRGINRSALVAALVARQLLNVSGARAVEIVREAKPGTLTNADFAEYLESLAAPEGANDTEHRNGGPVRLRTLADLDGRTRSAKLARKLVADIRSDLGGDLTAAQAELAQRAALLGAMLLDHETSWLERRRIDLAVYASLVARQCRVLEALGLARVPKNVTPNGATKAVIDALRASAQ